MTRTLGPITSVEHGRTHYASEPVVFHCNFYNFWLQKTQLLDETLGMEAVIRDAAAASAFAALTDAAGPAGVADRAGRVALAQDTFAELGFGTIQLGGVNADGGVVTTPVSHYGSCLRQATGQDSAHPQAHFDAGYAAAAAAFVEGLPAGSFQATTEACLAMGAAEGRIRLTRVDAPSPLATASNEAHFDGDVPAPYADTPVNEAAILDALSGLDFSGNEEGLLPRFGVSLTNHFASFYNRTSFEFVRRMQDSGLLEAAESLLVDAGYRCAFHTFGGIMISPEWDAVVRPQCKSKEDWVHGMVAVVNSLGWGTWRVTEISDDHVVVRIYDDYESCGWLDLYGEADRPVSFLHAAAVAGMMNLIHVGHIEDKPTLDLDFYATCFESDGLFQATQASSMAMGDGWTEIVAKR